MITDCAASSPGRTEFLSAKIRFLEKKFSRFLGDCDARCVVALFDNTRKKARNKNVMVILVRK